MRLRKGFIVRIGAVLFLAVAAHLGVMNVPSGHAQELERKPGIPPTLKFEVASVRTSGPLPAGMALRGRISGGPGTNDPERLIYDHVPFQFLIMAAYGVEVYQIKGPDWVTPGDLRGALRFDIAAKIPSGATREQAATMLQSLLTERFQLKLHHQSADFAGYALVVAKGGPKLNKSRGPVEESERGKPSGVNGAASQQFDKDGFPKPAAGINMGGDAARDGIVRLRFRDYPLSDFTQQLSFALSAHLIDRTELKGNYDFTLEFSVPPQDIIVGMQAARPLSPGQIAPLYREPVPAEQDGVAIISAALERQLGLKLDDTKIAIDTLVIDHVEKIPTDN